MVTLYVICVALPWIVNFDVFRPYVAAMVRTQGATFSVLLAILCLAWYRQRYVDRAREALMLRQLVMTDLFVTQGTAGATDAVDAQERRVTA